MFAKGSPFSTVSTLPNLFTFYLQKRGVLQMSMVPELGYSGGRTANTHSLLTRRRFTCGSANTILKCPNVKNK